MHKENLPQKVDPFRFADNKLTLQGSLSLKDMHRLSASLTSDEGEVDVSLAFGVDEQKIRFVRGHVTTHLVLQCQRCMEPFNHEINHDVVLGFIHSEDDIEALPESYDPVVVKDNEFFIADLIEEELLVSLPIVPMHPADDCKVKLPFAGSSSITVEKENPFKVIESLRSKRGAK
jgi:uncharacterized protein